MVSGRRLAWLWLVVCGVPAACSLVNEYQEVPTAAAGGAGGTASGGGGGCTVGLDCDDAEPCTEDRCVVGACEHQPLASGTPCILGGSAGTCDESGGCQVACTASTAAQVCDDGNGCTADGCDEPSGQCFHDPLDGMEAPQSSQQPGDCQVVLCQAGSEQPTNDDSDLPDDSNECTTDECNQGVPSNPPVPTGQSCTDPNNTGATVCDDAGACVECNGPADCTLLPANDECQSRTCVGHMCGQTFTADGTPTSQQQPGDCQTQVCDGAGGKKQVADTADLPVDGNDCTQDLCSGSQPSNPPEPLNSPCGNQGQLYCDGTGSCIGCTGDSQCPADVFCRDNYCNGQGQCAFTNTANNTPLPNPDQTPGDCQELRCNGAGGVKSVAVNDPGPDSNQCTDDLCLNGANIHPALPINTGCSQNGGSYCDGNGSCVQCNSASQCPTAPACQYRTCISQSCGTGNESSATPAPSGYQTSQDCRVVMCDGNGAVGSWVADDGDPPPDEPNPCTLDQCDGAGNPVHPPVPNGTACNDGFFCTAADTCQGGICSGSGDPCPGPDGDGNCAESCDEPINGCTAPDPAGGSCGTGLYCDGTGQCVCGFVPTPPGGSCPGVCTSCTADTCKIDCIGSTVCKDQTITCPAGWSCLLTCDSGGGKDACRNVTLNCPAQYGCDVVCTGYNACRDASVFCSTGTCSMSCNNSGTVCDGALLDCGANKCTATCTGSSKPTVNCGSSCNCTPCP